MHIMNVNGLGGGNLIYDLIADYNASEDHQQILITVSCI